MREDNQTESTSAGQWNFLLWWKRSLSALSTLVATSHHGYWALETCIVQDSRQSLPYTKLSGYVWFALHSCSWISNLNFPPYLWVFFLNASWPSPLMMLTYASKFFLKGHSQCQEIKKTNACINQTAMALPLLAFLLTALSQAIIPGVSWAKKKGMAFDLWPRLQCNIVTVPTEHLIQLLI